MVTFFSLLLMKKANLLLKLQFYIIKTKKNCRTVCSVGPSEILKLHGPSEILKLYGQEIQISS